jgi:hypothetical protein
MERLTAIIMTAYRTEDSAALAAPLRRLSGSVAGDTLRREEAPDSSHLNGDTEKTLDALRPPSRVPAA